MFDLKKGKERCREEGRGNEGGKKGKRDEFHVKINNKIKIYSLSRICFFNRLFTPFFSFPLLSFFVTIFEAWLILGFISYLLNLLQPWAFVQRTAVCRSTGHV